MCINYRHHHHFSSDEINEIKLFADQAAVAIHNAQLYVQLKDRLAASKALYNASRAVIGSLNLDEILAHIAEQAQKITGIEGQSANFANIMLVEGTTAKFVSAYPPKELDSIRARLGGEIDFTQGRNGGRIGVLGRAIQTRESQLVDDVTKNPDYLPSHSETRSELAVPIIYGGNVIGVINVESTKPNNFNVNDVHDLEALSAQAAMAIHNARQYQELLRIKGLIGTRTALAWMGSVATAWRHSIGNYTTTISDLVKLIRIDLEKGISISKIEKRLDGIEAIVSEIQKIPMPPLSTEEGVELVDINQLIEERITQYKRKKGRYESIEYKTRLYPSKEPNVRASLEWLRRLLDILIDNSVNAMQAVSLKRLVVETRQVGNGVEIAVIDTGPGIQEDVIPKLLHEPIKKRKDEKGLGVGLLLAQVIAETYEGRVEIGRTGSEGTMIRIWLPFKV